MRRLAVTSLMAMMLALLASPAQAELKLCNRTSYILYAATSMVAGSESQTQGWVRVTPGDCAVAIKQPLTGHSILVYARSSLAHSGPQHAWGGNFPVCVRDANFSLHQTVTAPYCTADGTFALPFAPVGVRGGQDWTMNFDDQPALPSLTAAQLAGVKRLLKDNGFAVGALDGNPDSATGKSLVAFRQRIHFAPTAGNTELFAALEKGAQGRAAPAGYTVCNDTKDDLLAAMGENSGGKFVNRGWWRIAGGACARTITTPLQADAVWLLAQRANGAVLIGGPDRFCIVPQEFEIQGRSNCAARGYGEAGFAKTVTRGSSGYVAHIGSNGLTAENHAGIPK